MKTIHSAGFTFNDLKLDNIMVDYGASINYESANVFKNIGIHLIDFGYAQPYMVDGVHISKTRADKFRGNFIFASISQLRFKTTSRADDMISLVYLLVYLFNGKGFLGIDYQEVQDLVEQMNLIKKVKKEIRIKALCCDNAKCLI